MSNVKICDRCGEQFSGWRAITREYILRQDVLKNSTTPTVRHKPKDLCYDCHQSLKEWFENGEDQ